MTKYSFISRKTSVSAAAYGCIPAIKMTAATALSPADTLPQHLSQTGVRQFCSESVSTPQMTVTETMKRYAALTYGAAPESESSADARTAPPVLSAKNGRNSSMAAAQSRRPKVRLRRRASLSRLSSSAMDSSASPESSSSIETAKYFDMAFRESIFGYPLPVSHS